MSSRLIILVPTFNIGKKDKAREGRQGQNVDIFARIVLDQDHDTGTYIGDDQEDDDEHSLAHE